MSAGAREDRRGDPLAGVLQVPQAVPGRSGHPGRGDDEGDAVAVPAASLSGRGLRLASGPAGRTGRSPEGAALIQ